jgi:hypothetical protein
MTIDDQKFSRAYELWESFKQEVLYKNRFIVKHEVFDYLKHVAETYKRIIGKGTILYRARLFTGNDSFLGY